MEKGNMTPEDRMERLSQLPLTRVGGLSAGSGGFWSTVREILGRTPMLALLVRRDIKARYKDSSLGLLWTLIRPLTQLMIFYLVVGKFLQVERGIPEFAIYIFSGLTVYGLFSEIISSGTGSIVGNSGIIKKVYLPRELFPMAATGTALFNFSIQAVILIIATFAVGSPPLTGDLIYVIPSILLLIAFAFAIALLLSAINVYLRDVQYLVEVFLMVMMYASPIIYSWTMVKKALGDGILLQIYTNNPVTLAVLGFQRAFWTAGHVENYPDPTLAPEYPDFLLLRILIALVVCLFCVFISQRIFARLQGNFAQAL